MVYVVIRLGGFFGAAVTAFLLLVATQEVWAQASPAAYCRQIGTDDTLHAVPPLLIPAVARLFQLEAMPASSVSRSYDARNFVESATSAPPKLSR